MPRLTRRAGEAGLREYLIAEAVDFRDLYVDGSPDFESALSMPVTRLVGGEAYRFCRYELPPQHPARFEGGMSDHLVLTAADTLTPSG